MNRRQLMTAMSVFPFAGIGKQKIQLDRIRSITTISHGREEQFQHDIFGYAYYEPESIKQLIKQNDVTILRDDKNNSLKVNKLNKGLILLKLDLVK